MFQNNSSLADEITLATSRTQRARTEEPHEIERARRVARGQCERCPRKRTKTGKLCTWCRRKIEANTVRDAAKQERRGRLSIAEADAQDLKLAVQAICAGTSGLAAMTPGLAKFERQRAEVEPLSQLLLAVKSAFEVAKRRGQVDEWLAAIRQSLARE